MIKKKLEDITLKDLEDLVKNSVSEKKTIEYKQSLPGNSDSDRKEFLADASSFANASGGDLIYGIVESGGVPIEIKGVTLKDADEEIRKYENIIRDGIAPRINITVYVIKIDGGKAVLIFRISNSWSRPHRVIFKGHDKFYSRNSAGKYPLDVDELRSVFTLTQSLSENIRNFRVDRISQLNSNITPIPFYQEGKIVLHLIPFDSFNPGYKVDFSKITSAQLRPIYSSGWNHRINLEGILTYSGGRRDKSHTYVQLYRNGIIEATEGLIISDREGQKFIPSVAYEKEIIEGLSDYLVVLKELEVYPPVAIFLTLLGAKGYRMSERPGGWADEHYEIDRDILLLPESIIESYDVDPKNVLKPIFDLIWNACGYEKSLNFDQDGNWKER